MVCKNANDVEKMFSAIAPTYDILNHFLSFGIDRKWRKKAIRRLAPVSGLYLDMAAGTGDMAVEILRVCKNARVIAADRSLEMLKAGVRKTAGLAITRERVDALALPFRDDCFSGVTCAFGIRNFSNLKAGLKEMLRALKPGGNLVVLEFATPPNPLVKTVYLLYFTRLLPFIGRVVSGHGNAYSYLPKSVRDFPDRRGLKKIFMDVGFKDISVVPLTFGICSLIHARKSAL